MDLTFESLLRQYEAGGDISPADAAAMDEQYQLRMTRLQSVKDQEAILTKKHNSLLSDITSEHITLTNEQMKEADESRELTALADLCERSQDELDQVEKLENLARFDLGDLRKKHDDLVATRERHRAENSSLVEPVLTGLRQELLDIGEELRKGEEALTKDEHTKDDLLKRLAELEAVETRRREEEGICEEALTKAKGEPAVANGKRDNAKKALRCKTVELEETLSKIRVYDEEYLRQEKKRTDGEHMKLRLLEKNELHRQTLQQRQQDSGVVMMDLDTELKRDNDLRGRLAAAATNLKDVESELFFLHKKQARLHKDLDDVMKKIRARRGIADAATAVIPKLEEGLSDVTTSIKLYERECAAVRVEVQRLRDEVLEYKVRFATLEGEEKIRQEELTDLDAGVEAVETEVFQLLAEEKKLGKMLHAYTAQRDLKFRENARLESKERQAHYQVRTRQLSIVDLTKRCSELGNRLKEFSALYEVVKNERNKYVNLIQNSTQALAEMREKIRILQNEIEILGQEFGTKDKALAKERAAHLNARNHRDSIRQEMSKLLYDYRSKQGVIEQQVLEIDKLNAVINLVERDMIELKGRYEHAVRDRNGVGIRLIDCNDELCLLYERSNHHLQTIHRGTAEYASKESELRLSRLQAEELTRELKAAEKRVPQMDMLHASIARLKEEVSRCRLDMDELSQKLETPANKERWRALEGSDLEEGQLQDKILLLETRINDKRAQLLEKDLLLEEVTSLTTKLGAQARAKRDVAKSLTDQLNELQCRIRDTTKRMLAAVSELSMYQATALRLQQEKALREEALERARHRVQIGEPPSEEAVRDLYRTERRREQLGESMQRRLEAERLLATRPMHATKTTAEPRPTAYVPDDEMGIPKPYGKTAPFKPTENGASMRHIRVPIVKDIEV